MKRRAATDTLAVVSLFTIFLCVSAALLLFGLQVWRQISARSESDFATQTPLAFVAAKVRQNDAPRVTAFEDGTPALVMESDYYGERYYTWLYCYDGGLYELFLPWDIQLTPQDGTLLIETAPIDFQTAPGGVQITTQDGALSLFLAPRTLPGEEVVS